MKAGTVFTRLLVQSEQTLRKSFSVRPKSYAISPSLPPVPGVSDASDVVIIAIRPYKQCRIRQAPGRPSGI